jgi:hypothetical protein
MSDNINLVGTASPSEPLKVAYEVDPQTGNLTLTFKNKAGTNVYGSLKIESTKHRALMEALATIAKALYPNSNTELFKHRLIFNLNEMSGLVSIEPGLVSIE